MAESNNNKLFLYSFIMAFIISIPAILLSLSAPEYMSAFTVIPNSSSWIRLLRSFVIGGIFLYLPKTKFLGIIILLAGLSELLGGSIIPQADHYNLVIVTPLILIGSIVLLNSNYLIKQWVDKHIVVIIIVIILIAAHAQIQTGLHIPKATDETKALQVEFDKLLYDTYPGKYYPSSVFIEEPQTNNWLDYDVKEFY